MTDLKNFAPPIEDSVKYYLSLFKEQGITWDEEFIREQLTNQQPRYIVWEGGLNSGWHYDILPTRPLE